MQAWERKLPPHKGGALTPARTLQLHERRCVGGITPQRQSKRARLWLNDGSCIRLKPERQNHVWAYDFVEDRTHDGRKLLPSETPDNQYRVKNLRDNHERVVRESQLRRG